MRKRFLNIAIALGMIVGLLAGVVGSASAATPTKPYNSQNWIFFPWVPNGEVVDGTGPWYGSVTIQNIENSPVQVLFGPTAALASGSKLPTPEVTIAAHAAYTFSAADLFGTSDSGIYKGFGGGVAATARWDPNNLPDFCVMSPATLPVGTAYPGNWPANQTLVVQRDDDVQNLPDGTTKTADQDILAGLPAGAKIVDIAGSTTPYATGNTTTDFGAPGTGAANNYTVNGNEITWTGTRPGHNSQYTVYYQVQNCGEKPMPFIAGVEKQATAGTATPETNGFMVSTNSNDLTVDGYTAVSDADVAWGPNSQVCNAISNDSGPFSGNCNDLGQYFLGLPIGNFFGNGAPYGFDGNSYLPIVQSHWSGWDTAIYVTNVDASTPSGGSQVAVTLYNQGQGVGSQAVAVKQFNLVAGSSVRIDVDQWLTSLGISNFLGSAWITSDYGVVANTVRIKAANNMAMINTSVPSILSTTSPTAPALDYIAPGAPGGNQARANGEFTMYAPLVYKNYNGWNTGINIANTSEFQNQVTVQFFSNDGTSMGTCTTAIPAKGMQYCYIPASQDQGLGNGDFGSAVITGNAPFAATVDEVKYSTGEAMSYPVTGTTIRPDYLGYCQSNADVNDYPACVRGNMLALPLFQNGHNVNGVEHGDTSGINIFNPGNNVAKGTVTFYGLDGSLQTPSNIGSVPFSAASMSTALIYAPSFAQMTPGIQLTAVITVDSGRVVAVSNNVNYDVNGDGGTVFNLENQFGQYRYVCSQEQCGIQAILVGR